jgi:beta-galactosidase
MPSFAGRSVGGSLISWSTVALVASAAPLYAQAPRTVTQLDQGWRYFDGDAPGAEAPDFEDFAWQGVSIPHNWNRVGYYHHDLGGTNRKETVNKRQGAGWYRLRFAIPAASSGKRHWLEFDAASRAAKVWLNGKYLGEHEGGFSRFRFDATASLRAVGDNVLVVRVDNSSPQTKGSKTADILPLTGDFFVHGGLYRPVRLVTTAPLHIDLGDFGGPGVRATTVSADTGQATIDIAVRVTNTDQKPARASIKYMLVDQSGHEVASALSPIALESGKQGEVATKLAVSSPRLWQGVDDPYLYTLIVQIVGPDGKVIDEQRQSYGIRTMAFDPVKGFLLNGISYRLRGVGYHQDRDGKGWAISRADVEEDVATIREMGANSIRLTHYQHGSDIHEIADRTGIILWDEIPLVTAWTRDGQLEPNAALVANAKQQMLELIRQNQNHASSAIWGLANEVDFGNSLPAFLTGGSDGKELDPMPLLKELQSLTKTADPHRPTAIATCCEGRLFSSSVEIPITAPAADLGGANRYFGWYYGEPNDLGPHLDGLRLTRPEQALAVTEYGAGGALTIHTDNVHGGPVDPRGGPAQPEEYLSYIHETALAQLDARPWLYATWLWNSFDFATTVRTEGDAQDINTKGLVAYDHKTRKDAFYFYKANWNPAPMVHITGKRYTKRAYPVADIKVYSNNATTDLLLNGRSLGAKQDCPQRICLWPAVALDEGVNTLVARGKHADGIVEDKASWELAPETARHFIIDAGAIMVSTSNNRVIGSDNWFTGGTSASLDTQAGYGRPAVLADIPGTAQRTALASYRKGTFSYRIPVKDGTYRVTLWFATPADRKPGSFDVKSGKRVLLQKFQPTIPATTIAAESKSFRIKAKGKLDLDFIAGTTDAHVSMIEIERMR